MARDCAALIWKLADESNKQEKQLEEAQRTFALDILRPGARTIAAVAHCFIAFDSKGHMKFAHVVHQPRRQWLDFNKPVLLCSAAAETYAIEAFMSELEQVAVPRWHGA